MGNITKNNDEESGYNKPRNLGKSNREGKLKIVNSINYFFNRPDACVTSYFFHEKTPKKQHT